MLLHAYSAHINGLRTPTQKVLKLQQYNITCAADVAVAQGGGSVLPPSPPSLAAWGKLKLARLQLGRLTYSVVECHELFGVGDRAEHPTLYMTVAMHASQRMLPHATACALCAWHGVHASLEDMSYHADVLRPPSTCPGLSSFSGEPSPSTGCLPGG